MNLTEVLASSKVYQDYERAFSETTGLPVTLRPVESWQLPHHEKRNENTFCSMVAQKSRSCAACLQVQQQLAEGAKVEPQSITCHFGLCDTVVPVRLGEQLIGFLQTGQVFRRKPTNAQFERTAKLAEEWGRFPGTYARRSHRRGRSRAAFRQSSWNRKGSWPPCSNSPKVRQKCFASGASLTVVPPCW